MNIKNETVSTNFQVLTKVVGTYIGERKVLSVTGGRKIGYLHTKKWNQTGVSRHLQESNSVDKKLESLNQWNS
jgi:hypothetical protein